MSKEVEQPRTPGEDRAKEEMRFLALVPIMIPLYFGVCCVADVVQETKHLYYHIRGIPHQFNEDITTHNWPDFIYERLDRPHALNPQEDEHFIMRVG